MKKISILSIGIVLCLACDNTPINSKEKTLPPQESSDPKVILITMDGFRWQELFTGADKDLIANTKYFGGEALEKEFWKETPEERRKIIMPFVWDTLNKIGVLHGNRIKGSKVNITNKMWFSYPGYNEILTGKADDENVTSNDKIYNPNTTILEEINRLPHYKDSVAAFSSWDVFPYIINDKRSGIPVNSGYSKVEGEQLSEVEIFLNQNTHSLPSPFGNSARLDMITNGYAMEYMKRKHPKVTYIAFDETDDFAHQGFYNLYLHSAQAADSFIEQLWNYTQRDPFYAKKTTFIITTDHGRGAIEQWKDHGKDIKGADQTWLIMFGAGITADGEVQTEEQVYTTQIAKEIKKLLKF